MIVGCYLDDSRGSRRNAIAGYLGPMESWDRCFVPVWSELLRSAPHPITEYKSSAIRNLKGEFSEEKGWTKDEAEAFSIRAIQTLADSVAIPELYGIGTAMIAPRTEGKKDAVLHEAQAITLCFSTILVNAINFLRRWVPRVTSLQVVHDEQPGMKGKLSDAFDDAKRIVADDCPFQINGLDFRHSHELLPLQAADILAHETRRELLKRLANPQGVRSLALAHLLSRRPHVGFYVDYSLLDEVRDSSVLPPVLYESPEARAMMPWIENSKTIDPPPLLPGPATAS